MNLVPYLRGENTQPPHEALFWRTGGGVIHAARVGDKKLLRRKDGTRELYDLRHDNGETHDLASTQTEEVRRLDALLTHWNNQLVPPLFPPLSHEPDGDGPIPDRIPKKQSF